MCMETALHRFLMCMKTALHRFLMCMETALHGRLMCMKTALHRFLLCMETVLHNSFAQFYHCGTSVHGKISKIDLTLRFIIFFGHKIVYFKI
jgi:hypothetical protein